MSDAFCLDITVCDSCPISSVTLKQRFQDLPGRGGCTTEVDAMISGIFAFDFECSIIYKESRNISNAPAVQSTAGARLYSAINLTLLSLSVIFKKLRHFYWSTVRHRGFEWRCEKGTFETKSKRRILRYASIFVVFSIVIVRYSEKFSFSGLLTLFSRNSFRSCWLNP